MDLWRGNVILYSRYFARNFSLSCSSCEDNVQWKKKKKKKKKKQKKKKKKKKKKEEEEEEELLN